MQGVRASQRGPLECAGPSGETQIRFPVPKPKGIGVQQIRLLMQQGSYKSRKYLAGGRWVDNNIYFLKSYWIESLELVFIKKFAFHFEACSQGFLTLYGSLPFTHKPSHYSAREQGSSDGENTK